jgi:hypothetical protein
VSNEKLVPIDIRSRYQVYEWRNALPILKVVHPQEWRDLLAVLRAFKPRKSTILDPGKNKSGIARSLDNDFYARGWTETNFQTAIQVDESRLAVPTHKVDCFRNRVGVEVEWNNKDAFFDRDLNNFRLLFDLRALDVGIIITRHEEMQKLFDELGKGDSYGSSTTHMGKLLPKIEGGGAGGCPILAFGIRQKLFVDR